MSGLLGVGDSQISHAVPAPGNFLSIVGTALDFDSVTDRSIPGEASIGVVNRLDAELAAYPATTRLLVSTGGNDVFAAVAAGSDNDALATSMLANWSSIITKAQAVNVPLTILSPAGEHIQSRAADPSAGYFSALQYHARLDVIVPRLAEMCRRHGVHFIDIYEAFKTRGRSVTPNAYNGFWDYEIDPHYNAAAHAFIADLILKNSILPHVVAPPSDEIPQNAGVVIGDMSAMPAAFDGVNLKASGACTNGQGIGVVSYVGKRLSAPVTVSGFRAWGSTDKGFCNTAANFELQLWGRLGSDPAGASDGTYLGGSGDTADAASKFVEKTDATQMVADRVWLRMISTGAVDTKYLSQVRFIQT